MAHLELSRLVLALPQSKAQFITLVRAFFFRGATVETGENVSCYLPVRVEEQIWYEHSGTLDTWVIYERLFVLTGA